MSQFIAKIIARWHDEYKNVVTIKQGLNAPDIYVAMGLENGWHASYHRDGRYHWKANHPISSKPVQLYPEQYRQPLSNLNSMQNLVTLVVDVSRCELTQWKPKKASQTLIFDVDDDSSWLNVVGMLMPPGDIEELTHLTETMRSNVDVKCLHVITKTDPWIGFVIYTFKAG